MQISLVSLLIAPSVAQLFCPTGQGLFHTTHLVKSKTDDVEEAHGAADGTPPTDCQEGFLYQGSSDLELGQDVECGRVGGQYVGIRFQDVNVPAGATIMQAHLKFTVDESTNPGDHGTSTTGTNQHGNWTAPLTATIKARKVANAPEWLDPTSTDPRVVSNRDCPRDSKCLNNYDCNAIALNGQGWGIQMSQEPSCAYLESTQFGTDFKASGLDPNWLGLSREAGCVANCPVGADGQHDASCLSSCPEVMACDCSGCLCKDQTGAKILHNVFTAESTTASVNWSPEGESISKAQISDRRPTSITTDMKGIVQEVVDLNGWASGNAMAFVLDGNPASDGTGAVRSYESFDGSNSAEHLWTSSQASFGPTLSIAYCAPVTCPAGQIFRSEIVRVDNALDDVEEAQVEAGKDKPGAGYLYQGSSDLEIGNDPEVGGAQYVGLRFQNSPVPKGATIRGASLMLTIDESYNRLQECDTTTHDPMVCRRFNEWMTATIKMRKIANAPEWLDPASTDPDVIANRDCSRDPISGVIDSVCYTNYDCDAVSQWVPIRDYINEHFPNGLPNCDFFTKPGGINGKSFYEAATTAANWEYPPTQALCSCNSCKCTGVPVPQILHKSFTEEGTSASVKWEPGGEHMPHCEGSCPSNAARVQFTTDFREVLQEVIDLPGYKRGNSLAVIIDGHQHQDGTPALRSYESWDGTNTNKHAWTSGRPAFGPTLFVSFCEPEGSSNGGSGGQTASTKNDGPVIGGVVGGISGFLVLILCLFICTLVTREKKGKPIFAAPIKADKVVVGSASSTSSSATGVPEGINPLAAATKDQV